ncbi:MAG: protein kinase [Nannocystaceae bacterium]
MTPRLPIGSVVAGRFRVAAWIGEGGMGSIYRADDLHEGGEVALKILQGSASDDRRFAREAQILAELVSPAIVRHVAHGRIGEGPLYLAMEWLEGEDLGERLRRGPLGVDASRILLRRVAEGLLAAHARGVVHRDIKPANLLAPGGSIDHLKILDFGIARREGESLALTRTGVALGTPNYMSPEQVRGSRDVGPQSDVFSLGAVLYEALSGRQPFVADGVAEVFTRILYHDPPPLAKIAPSIPDDLAELCARMLAKSPEDRPEGARGILAALDSDPTPRDHGEPTLIASYAGGTAAPAAREQHLCSVVYASPAPRTGDPVGRGDETTAPRTESVEVERAIAGLGAHLDRLVDGAWVVTMPSSESAVDQALLGARVALMLRDRSPGAAIALSTGLCAVSGRRAVGEAVDRALRLLGERGAAAGDAGIWLDPLSARLIERSFAIHEEATGVHRLIGERSDADEGRALLGRPTPCVGRESELGSLELVFRTCSSEQEARAVVITGAAGSGKSRVCAELLRRLRAGDEAPLLLEGRAELILAGAPHAILGQALRRLVGARRGEHEPAARARFVARIAADVPADEAPRIVEFLAEIAGLSGDDEPSPRLRAARSDPKIMRGEVRRAFIDWLGAITRATPVVLVLEDLHWGDGLSVALLDEALRALREAPLMILAVGRPELSERFPGLWREHSVQEIALGPLSRRAAQRLCRHVLGPDADEATIARMIEASGGNALYLEELIRAAVEAGEAGEDTAPVTVVAMIQARMSRLGAVERQILAVASVFGAAFPEASAEALIAGLSPARITEGLDRLVALEILEELSAGERGRALRFRHDLIREAVYGLLVAADRHALHRAVGLHLAARGDEPLGIAEHLSLGGEAALAARWTLAAAEAALASDDLAGAAGLCERGLAAVADDEVRGRLLALRSGIAYWQSRYPECLRDGEASLAALAGGTSSWYRAIGQACVAAARLGDPAAQSRLQALAEVPADPADRRAVVDRFVALTRCATQWIIAGDDVRAEAIIAALEAESGQIPADEVAARAHYYQLLGMRAAGRGDPFGYVARLGEVVGAFEAIGDAQNAAVERATLAACLGQIGELDRGVALCTLNLRECERLGNHQALTYTRMTLGGLLCARRETLAEGLALLDAVEGEYVAIAYTRRLGILHLYRAHGAAVVGDREAAAAFAAEAVVELEGTRGFQSSALALQALLLVEGGRHGEAAALFARSEDLSQETGSSPLRPFLRDLVAIELALVDGRPEDARARARAAHARASTHAAAAGFDPVDALARMAASVPEAARIVELAADGPSS